MSLPSGITDRPAKRTEDLLGLGSYADSLATFMLSCETPITIGIQGDWGAGKTSLMEMVREIIRERCVAEDCRVPTVWFNTWMYSQFNAGDQLALLMLTAFIKKLPQESCVYEKAIGYLTTLGKLAAGVAAKQLAGVELEFQDAMPGATGQVLEELRAKFAEIVAIQCAGNERSRMIFFVDDLDRLLPEKAVELMEVIKVFLDAPKVVFVLACDYQVVARGIRAKYGLSEEGAYEERSFFDKIIQVPFRMPMHSYDLNGYVGDLLKRIGWTVSAGEIDDYRSLLETSVGFNPRSIKRLFNTTLLLTTMLSARQPDILGNEHLRKLLFAVECMEMKYPSLHAYLARDTERVTHLQDEGSLEELASAPETYYDSKLQPMPHFTAFATKFYRLVDKDSSGQISPNELQDLSCILGLSRITSVEEEPTSSTRVSQEWKEGKFADGLRTFCPATLAASLEQLLQRDFGKTQLRYYKEQDHIYCEFGFSPARIRREVRPFAIYDDGRLVIHRRRLLQAGRKWSTVFLSRLIDWLESEQMQYPASSACITICPEALAAKWSSFEVLVEELAKGTEH